MKKLLILTCLFMLFGGSKTYADDLSRRIFIELQGELATSWSWKNQAPIVWNGSSVNPVETTLKKDSYTRESKTNKLYYADITGKDLSDLTLIITSGEGKNDQWHAVTVEDVDLSTTNKIFYIYVEDNECKAAAADYIYKFVHWESGGEHIQTDLTYSGNNLVGTYNNTGEQYGVVFPTLVLNGGPFSNFYWEFAHRPKNSGSDFLINNFIVYSDALTGNDKSFKFTEDMYYDLSFTISSSSTFNITPYIEKHISSVGYATLGTPVGWNMKVPEGVTAYYVTGVADGEATMSSAITKDNTLPGNNGFLLQGDEGDYKFYASNGGAVSTDGNKMVSTGENGVVEANVPATAYILALNDKGDEACFYKYSGKGDISAFKAYLNAGSGSAKSLAFNFDGNKEEEEVTAINAIANTVDNNAAMFNLAGQRVNNDYKGVVVKNGKKFIVK